MRDLKGDRKAKAARRGEGVQEADGEPGHLRPAPKAEVEGEEERIDIDLPPEFGLDAEGLCDEAASRGAEADGSTRFGAPRPAVGDAPGSDGASRRPPRLPDWLARLLAALAQEIERVRRLPRAACWPRGLGGRRPKRTPDEVFERLFEDARLAEERDARDFVAGKPPRQAGSAGSPAGSPDEDAANWEAAAPGLREKARGFALDGSSPRAEVGRSAPLARSPRAAWSQAEGEEFRAAVERFQRRLAKRRALVSQLTSSSEPLGAPNEAASEARDGADAEEGAPRGRRVRRLH